MKKFLLILIAICAMVQAQGYYHLKGKIADQYSIEMDLVVDDALEIKGGYYYLSTGQPISLSGRCEGDDYVMTTTDYTMKEKFVLQKTSKGFTGSWIHNNKTSKVSLSEDYTDSYQFGVASISKEVTAQKFNGEGKPSLDYHNQILYPKGEGSAKIQYLFDKTKRNYSETKMKADASESVADTKKFWEKASKEDYASVYTSATDNRVSVVYNKKGYVVLEDTYYMYAGGAHGLGGVGYDNLDVRNGKAYDLYDILADTTQMLEIAKKNFINKMKSRSEEGSSLEDFGLFSNDLPMPSSAAILPSGVLLNYNQYEVGPYAMGSIQIFVKASQLQPTLKNKTFFDRFK